MGCFNKYLMSFEPECLSSSFRSFYHKYSAMTKNDTDFCALWIQRMENGLA
jgi:ribosomal protein L20